MLLARGVARYVIEGAVSPCTICKRAAAKRPSRRFQGAAVQQTAAKSNSLRLCYPEIVVVIENEDAIGECRAFMISLQMIGLAAGSVTRQSILSYRLATGDRLYIITDTGYIYR
jgi:hypothetical protein